MAASVIELRDQGMYCAAGDFFVDPWEPVARAVITHGHSDHARPGVEAYLTSAPGRDVVRRRVGADATIDTLPYGERKTIGDATVSLHPAGHCLGSAQVRIEVAGEVWVVSGDYKLEADPTSASFEPVPCDAFVTESTFGLPVFRWAPARDVFAEIDAWWRANADAGRPSVLAAYALGKAPRVLAGVDRGIGPILTHGAIEGFLGLYRDAGVDLPVTEAPPPDAIAAALEAADGRALVVAPPSALRSGWIRRFGDAATGFVSGWMQLRGARRRRNVERGFALSDHADWPGLLHAVEATGARRVIATHGFSDPFARYLRERGLEATTFETRFVGDDPDVALDEDDDAALH